jgi:ribonuclease T1
MTKQKKERKPRENRPTDPFGGPNNRGNTISLTLVLAALAFFLILQWSGGDLAGILNAPGAGFTPVASAPTPTEGATVESAPGDTGEGQPSQAQATAAPQTQAPAATATVQARPTQTPRPTDAPTPTANAPPLQRASDLPTITYEELPPEAHDTIALIEQGGPFPFSRDGITFENRERILPRQPQGYYHEYTVITPGSSTRGARRIVTGEEGEMYYTDDHYESFREIVR